MKRKSSEQRKLVMLDGLVAVTAISLISFGLWQSYLAKASDACEKPGQSYEIFIKDGDFSTDKITIRQCDTLKVVNLDEPSYQIAFGTHDQHITYPGFAEVTLRTKEYVAIDAVKTGSYRLHDHIQDKASTQLVIEDK